MKYLLLYGSVHTLYFDRVHWLPKLNPYSSRSHQGEKRTWKWDEPTWLFKLRRRLFAFAGNHRCPERDVTPFFSKQAGNVDSWHRGLDGNRTCSFCGSMHPDDFMAHCARVIEDERYAVERAKSYKFYVKQPDVRNACEGAITFYMHHAPSEPTELDQMTFNQALRISNKRWHEKFGQGAA